MALRSGKKWSEFELSVRPLDVIEAVRKVNAIQMGSNRPPRIRPRLADSHISGNIVLRAADVAVGYPGNLLFAARDVELRRGECAALIGPNGAGKTSFLKTMLGQIEPLAGSVRLGAGLKIGYFAQAQDALDDRNNVLDELLRHKKMDPGEARNLLAAYLFQGDDVFKPVEALSGGERARLALAILTLEGANFLVLDEPTNHLDIPAREALQEVLENFNGTILLVSHDRYLVNRLATQIWDLQKGKLTIFHGSYREYLLRRTQPAGKPAASRQTILSPRPMARDNSKETRKRQEALAQLEQRIREQEASVQRISGELQKAGAASFDKVHKLSEQMAQAQARLDDLMNEWERLAV
jgi:ATP-binding cassette subfamily F protein 3